MKTVTSFHCNTCGHCVEYFDHHCPYINNCLGYRNHKYFLVFICAYALFLIVIMLETLRHLIEICMFDENVKINGTCFQRESLMFFVLLLITINMPIIFYQLYIQCKSVMTFNTRKPNVLPKKEDKEEEEGESTIISILDISQT